MIRQYQRGEISRGSLDTPQKRQTLITYRLDSELINQVQFLAKHLEIKQLEVLRQLVKEKICDMDLWSKYLKSPKKHSTTTKKVTGGEEEQEDCISAAIRRIESRPKKSSKGKELQRKK